MFVTIAPGSRGARHREGALPARPAGPGPARRRPHRDRAEQRPLDGGGNARPRPHALAWKPSADVPVGSYVMRLTIEGNGGRRVYGGRRPASPERASAPVVRVLGIEAAFTRRSYLPDRADGDARAGRRAVVHDDVPPRRPRARPEPAERRDGRARDGRSGADRLDRQAIDAPDDRGPVGRLAERALRGPPRVGRRPRRVRPVRPPRRRHRARCGSRSSSRRTPGRRTTSTTPTATAGGTRGTPAAGRPSSSTARIRDRGVPPRFRRYDFPFLRWLEKTRRDPDFLSDDDLDAIATGDELRRALRPRRVPGPHRVRDDPRLRRRRALPRRSAAG